MMIVMTTKKRRRRQKCLEEGRKKKEIIFGGRVTIIKLCLKYFIHSCRNERNYFEWGKVKRRCIDEILHYRRLLLYLGLFVKKIVHVRTKVKRLL